MDNENVKNVDGKEQQAIEQRTIVKLQDLPDEYEFKNARVRETTNAFGDAFLIFYDDKKTLVSAKSNLGKQMTKYKHLFESHRVNLEIKAFGEGQYRGFDLIKITNAGNLGRIEPQTEVEGF